MKPASHTPTLDSGMDKGKLMTWDDDNVISLYDTWCHSKQNRISMKEKQEEIEKMHIKTLVAKDFLSS